MNKIALISATLFVALLTLVVKPVNAQYGCDGQYGQYGGCPPAQSIMIDKTVGKMASNGSVSLYVDNLAPTDPKFKAGQYVFFQLKIKNTSNVTATNVKVVDYVPSYLVPVEGPGNFDSANSTISYTIAELKANEERLDNVKMQVKSVADLNSINAGTCMLNKASAAVNSAYDEDTSQFCVEKTVSTVTGVSQVPSTGPEDVVPVLVSSFVALGAGIALKKKAKLS